MKQAAIVHANHSSEGGTVPEIQSLTQTVRDFSQSVDLWNQLMLGGLALTVLAAVFVLVATRMVVFRSGQMSNAQDRLSEAKDRQLALDLKGKDLQIESLKGENLTLWKQVEPRSISLEQQGMMRASLSAFRGSIVWVVVPSMNDPESHNFAQQIWGCLDPKVIDRHMYDTSANGRQYSPITETGVLIRWTTGHRDIGEVMRKALEEIGGIRQVVASEGTFPVSGPTALIDSAAAFIVVYPKPYEVLGQPNDPTASNK